MTVLPQFAWGCKGSAALLRRSMTNGRLTKEECTEAVNQAQQIQMTINEPAGPASAGAQHRYDSRRAICPAPIKTLATGLKLGLSRLK